MSTLLKPGYKQTEVGVIPEEWEVKSLDHIGHVIRGIKPQAQRRQAILRRNRAPSDGRGCYP